MTIDRLNPPELHATPGYRNRGSLTTASTLLGVTRLGFPGQLVELDVTAATD